MKLALLIENYCNIAGEELNEGLALSLAEDMLDIMKYETLEDVAMMFKLMRQGKLTIPSTAKRKSFYLSITQDYIPAYLETKAQVREDVHREEKEKMSQRFIATAAGDHDPEETKKQLAKIYKTMGSAPVHAKGSNPVAKTQREEMRMTVERLSAGWSAAEIVSKIKDWKDDPKYLSVIPMLEEKLTKIMNDDE